jgi:uncharacterized protein
MAYVVVFDTNVLLSALLSLQGAPAQCTNLARAKLVESVTCAEILDEFAAKLETKFAYAPTQAQAAVAEVQQWSRLVMLTQRLQVVSHDPADNKIVECAVAGAATHIVTGDRRHLLPLGHYQGIVILNPAAFLQLVTKP